MENVARPGAEEQIDNEKYEYKNRHWEDYEPGGPKAGQSLGRTSRRLNEIRREHPALHWLRNIRSTTPTTRTSSCSPSAGVLPTAPRTRSSSSPTSTRTRPASRRVHLDMPALGLGSGRHRRPRPHHRAVLDLGRARLRAARPRDRARARHRDQEVLTAGPQPEPARPASTTRSGSGPPSSTRSSSARSATPRGPASGDFTGLIERLDYLQWLGIDCLWLPPFYASPLRDGGYDIADYNAVLPEFGTLPEFSELVSQAHARGIRDHHRPRHEPHQRPAPVVPGVALRPRGPVRRLLRVVRHRREVRRRAHHLHRHRGLQLDLRPGPPPVLLAPVLLPPARPQLREPRRARGDVRRRAVLDGPGHRRLPARRDPLPLRGGGPQRREPPEDAPVPRQAARRWSTRSTPAGCCSPRPTSRRPRSSTTSAPRRSRSARCASTSPSCRGSTTRCARRRRAPIIDVLADTPPIPARHPVGHVPAQPRRADPRDGDAGGARGDVRLVRPRPADARQRRHPPAAGAAAGQLPRRDRADPRPAAVAARLAVPLLRRRDRHGRQHLAQRP